MIKTEHDECVVFADYLRILKQTGKILAFTHVPNETFTKSWTVKRRNQIEGVTRGFPDYIVVTPQKIVFIEMKRVKGGEVSKDQKEWIEYLRSKDSVAAVCKGFDEAKGLLSGVLKQ